MRRLGKMTSRYLVVGAGLSGLAVVAGDLNPAHCFQCSPRINNNWNGWQRCSAIPYYDSIGNSGISAGLGQWHQSAASGYGQSINSASLASAQSSGIWVSLLDLGGMDAQGRGIGARVTVLPAGLQTSRVRAAWVRINNNSAWYDPNRSDLTTYLSKVTMHEVGHPFGLADMGGTCSSQTDGDSVMNMICGKHDSQGNMPTFLPSCDFSASRAYGSCPGGGSGRYECVDNAECGWNEYGIGEDTCNSGWDPENCGGDGEETFETGSWECEAEELSGQWCEQMCDWPYHGADWDLDCNGWADWDDCDYLYGECQPIEGDGGDGDPWNPVPLSVASILSQLVVGALLVLTRTTGAGV